MTRRNDKAPVQLQVPQSDAIARDRGLERLHDRVTGETVYRHAVDVWEIVAADPERYEWWKWDAGEPEPTRQS